MGDEPTLERFSFDLHTVLTEIRAQGPIVRVDALGGWMTTDHPTAVAVMRDPETFTVDDRRFATERVVGRSMLSTDGPEHERHRRPFATAYRRLAIGELVGWLREESRARVNKLRSIGSAELRRKLAGPLAVSSMIKSLGLVGADERRLLSWYDDMSAEITRLSASGDEPQVVETQTMTRLHDMVAASRQEQPLRGLGEALSLDELVSNVAVMLFGGIETGEGMISNLIWHLVVDGWWTRIRDEPHLRDGAVEESLRLEPAASRVDRYATRNVELAGVNVARGDLVMVSLSAANRDPAAFRNADSFDPERSNHRMQLAFAAGPHLCPGRHLARFQTRALLDALTEILPDLDLDRSRATSPTGLVFRKPDVLAATWTPS